MTPRSTEDANIVDTALPVLAPEPELVVRCARLDRTGSDADRLGSLLAGPLDWTAVLGLAQRHGLTSWLHRALRHATVSVPAGLGRLLECRSGREAVRNERLRAALGDLLDVLAGRRVDVLPLLCGWPGAWAGELIELDLLVRRNAVHEASSALIAHGLEPETALGPEAASALVRTHGARRFVHPNGGAVSLQWAIDDPAVVHGPAVERLWRRASADTLDGRPCLMLASSDLLQVACVRGTIRRWQRLARVREVGEIMAEVGPARLDDVLEEAARSGSRRALALGTSLATRLLGAATSPRLAEAAREGAVAELERIALAGIVAPARALPGPSDIARFHLAGRERARDRLRYVVRRATVPGPEDVVALPPPLFFLGPLVVPWRRAVRAGLRSARRLQWMRRSRRPLGAKIARFVRTPAHVVDRVLALAEVSAADTLLDIGCGDGAIVIRAAERVGCRGLGVDVDAELVQLARHNARTAGVHRLVEFRAEDARELDLSAPTVVTAYLSAAANLTLRPHLRRGLRPGTRVVSFNFDMGDWWPDAVEILDETAWGSNTLYLWRIEGARASRTAA
jgi:hypothetical protein